MRSKSAYNGKEKDKEMDSAGHALAGERCRRNGIGIGLGMGMGMVPMMNATQGQQGHITLRNFHHSSLSMICQY